MICGIKDCINSINTYQNNSSFAAMGKGIPKTECPVFAHLLIFFKVIRNLALKCFDFYLF